MIAVASLSAVVLLYVLVFWMYNQQRVDALRQALFEIRDELFDEARAGKIGFDSAAYRSTRLMINGIIRFGHRASLSQMLGARCVFKAEDRQFALARFEAVAFSACSAEDRKLCERYIERANETVARHLLSSPTLIVLLVPLVAVVIAYVSGVNIAAWVTRRWRSAFNALDRAAWESGKAVAAGEPVTLR